MKACRQCVDPIWKVAQDEAKCWRATVHRGLVMAILFCFVHRLTTGRKVEEEFSGKEVLDFQI